MKKTFYYENRLSFISAIFFGIYQSVTLLGISFVLREMMNTIAQTKGCKSLAEIAWMIVFLLLNLAFSYSMLSVFKPKFIKKAVLNYRSIGLRKILFLNQNYFKKEDTAVFLSEFTNDLNVIESDYLEANFVIVNDFISFIGALIIMLIMSPMLTGIVVLLIVLPMVVSMLAGKMLVPVEKKVSKENGSLMSLMKEVFQGFTVVKSFQAETEILNLLNGKMLLLESTKCKRNRIKLLVGMIGLLTSLFSQFGVFFAGVWMVITQKKMDAGTVILFVNLMNFIVSPLSEIPVLLSSKKSAEALIDKLDNQINQSGGTKRLEKVSSSLKQGICLENVSFGYEKGNEVLHQISYKFEQGKSYVIVGNSGSGKSTLLNLLKGGSSEYKGNIYYDDRELRRVSYESLFSLISEIEQNVIVFDAPIEDNIKMFKDFSEKAILQAEEKANVTDMIKERGKEFYCGENGKNLSGGEKQRISIARGLLKNAGVILADEPWSSLDRINASMIAKDIANLSDTIRIVITHSLDKEMLEHYDEIIVLHDGRIEESGKFDELLEKDGYFSALYQVSVQ